MKRNLLNRSVLGAGVTLSLCLALSSFSRPVSAAAYRGCSDGGTCNVYDSGQEFGGYCSFIANGGAGYCACTSGGAPQGTYACAIVNQTP